MKAAASSSTKNIKSRRTFNKNYCNLLTAITHTKILAAYFIISDKKTEVSVAHHGSKAYLLFHLNHIPTVCIWVTACKWVHPLLSDRCLSVLSVCDVGVLWPNGWMHQDKTWHGGRPQPRPQCFRWGPSSPSPKGHNPNFSSMSVVAKWLDGLRCHSVQR